MNARHPDPGPQSDHRQVIELAATSLDLQLLTVLRNGPLTCEEVADQLNIEVDHAQFRLEQAADAGLVAGPIVIGYGDHWDELGWGLLNQGRRALKAAGI